ncbi:MAG TPA: TatD family hydrolase [Candidatus Saccharimonadales bacterium]|nr:TatD family hydrolase [Candidatus Saccharimonadales bacterium]
MMELVDTHCHIQSIGQEQGERHTLELWKESGLEADTVIANALEKGVNKLICVGCDLNDSQQAIKFSSKRENCWASIGIHPHEAKDYWNSSSQLQELGGLAGDNKVVAIGECGLDYFYEHSPKDEQIELLKMQIELAIEHDLPLIFHVREAFADFWPIFDEYKGIRGVLHSFTDTKANMEEGLKRGLYFGVNGIATFAKMEAQLDMYKSIPLQNLLLETDAPYLTPTPYRGSINQPMRIGVIADFLSELRREDRSDLAFQTTNNANRLFKI